MDKQSRKTWGAIIVAGFLNICLAFLLTVAPRVSPDRVYDIRPPAIREHAALKQRITAKVQAEASRHQSSREMMVEATAYSYTGSRTFTGTWPKRGTVAVDPEVIPLGSQLWIEGYGAGVAEDTGSAIRGNRIDVFMETEAEALEWGRRWVRVRVYDDDN